MKSVIIYSSTDGQTRKICEFIKENLLNKSEHKLLSIENTAEFNLNNFDCIIIGASIRYGKHSAKVFDFIKNNIELIKVKKNGGCKNCRLKLTYIHIVWESFVLALK